VYKTMQVAE